MNALKENTYRTSSGTIHYWSSITTPNAITLAFLPGLTADHRLFERQMEYFSSAEYRKFYQIARNYQTRSLNVDATSVFFYGVLKECCNG